MQGRQIVTLSNFFSVLRIILIYPFYYFYEVWILHSDIYSFYWSTVILFFGAITDFLDGFFARKLGQITELGKILDPLADKIAFFCTALILYYYSDFPIWLVILVALRDILILSASLFMIGKIKEVPSSEWSGKIAMLTLTITILIYYFAAAQSIKNFFIIVSVITIAYSSIDYFLKFIRVIENAKNK